MLSVGIDLEVIARFAFLRTTTGGAFFRRVYTESERATFGGDLRLLALCFTAKEAVAKALGTGLQLDAADGTSCRDIEVSCPHGTDAPEVALAGGALAAARGRGFNEVLLRWRVDEVWACSLAGLAGDAAGRRELHNALQGSLELLARRATQDTRRKLPPLDERLKDGWS